jgi:hypothetical protein
MLLHFPQQEPPLMKLARTCPIFLGFLGLAWLSPAAGAVTPAPDVVQRLLAYNPQTGNPQALIEQVVPRLAPLYLQLGTNEIQRGGPLSETLGPSLLGKLDASPGSLPMVVYKKEEGRLPSAFIIARYRGVKPEQIMYAYADRDEVTRHPLVSQVWELTPRKDVDASAFGPGAVRKTSTSFVAVDMPFGAGLFGLRPSYALADWDFVLLPNGVAIASLINRPARPDEQARFKTFRNKKNREYHLDEDYHQIREYRLTHLLIPERDESGQIKNTIEVYFVRIIPALKPGYDLVGSGALARWIFARGAQDAVILPVKLTREGVERRLKAGK